MTELKINKKSADDQKPEEKSFVKEEALEKESEGEERKLFANKKANIALIALGVVIVVAIVAMLVISGM